MKTASGPHLSVVIPVFNEEESVEALVARVSEVLPTLRRSFEVIYVDDGSTDRTFELLKRLVTRDPRARIIRFRRNFGQTAAMSAGMKHARGEVIVPLDADLQNDPADIGKLLAKLEEGYDVVSGWRASRQDAFLTRTLPSRIANGLISWISGVRLHDYGCTLKAYRREIMQDVHLYGEMHRFIPIFAHQAGARVTELPVTHHPRRFGKSKYGLARTFKVLLDLTTVAFLTRFQTKPLYLFGTLGAASSALGVFLGLFTLFQKFYLPDAPVHRNPLFLVGVTFLLLGFNGILLGLIAELMMRTYYESQKKPIYTVREIVEPKGRS